MKNNRGKQEEKGKRRRKEKENSCTLKQKYGKTHAIRRVEREEGETDRKFKRKVDGLWTCVKCT